MPGLDDQPASGSYDQYVVRYNQQSSRRQPVGGFHPISSLDKLHMALW